MIRNIFIPESYRGYYLLQTNIVGVHITHNALYATQIIASGYSRTIQQHIYEPFTQQTGETFAERSEAAIANLKDRIGSHDRLHIALPSKEATYKELTLPFTDTTKIDMVAPFELEESLPYSLDEAIVTTLPIRQEAEQTTVLTATYRKETVDAYLAPFEAHGLHPDITTADTVALYNAFSHMQEFSDANSVLAYIDMDAHESRIFIIDHGALRVIRTISHGVSSICDISEDSYNALKKSISSCEVPQENVTKTQLCSDIQFTLAAADKMLGPDTDISQAKLTGLGTDVPDLPKTLSQCTSIQTTTMNPNLPLRMDYVTTQTNSHVPPIFMTSLAASLPVSEHQTFHIRRTPVTYKERTLRTKQLAVATGLTLFLFIAFFTYSMYTTRSFRNEISQRQEELHRKLAQTFDIQQRGGKGAGQQDIRHLLTQVIPKRVSVEENIWFSLSRQRTYSFLYYLQELSSHIDRTSLGLTLRKLTIQRDNKKGTETVKLEGNVPDFPQLQKFEQALKESKLFTNVPSLQETKFDVTLTIDQSPGEAA